ncbi:hypothetical protein BSIN_4407 [Burkholderia singularis]|uniref:Uncharacterized protein n=1 Tax=Burkholderia singularis TaxID=1503053 RepID=A0A238H949_9BURK|nr:hypothetical protein BSIN_4407 [Burkholderia singularis]
MADSANGRRVHDVALRCLHAMRVTHGYPAGIARASIVFAFV